MDEKSAVGSGGAFGRVYTISLPSGELVAVKKLVNIGSQTSKALKAEVKTLAKIRLRIAIGVAQGLAYLHKDYVPHLLHRNVKSKNILLDTDFEPKLTDFALDRLVGEAAFRSTIASESADSCYSAPELGYSKKATEQMDVYSFGVVLLELITGRQA
ncbi:probably inactive leucine-rich repeat receptor-like protein kinase At5g06940 [Hevea brasiliensis]|uniref:probably inactive leucine-rich repeat receptor-like protein kinase At5g06940 n=1 Tax=Hevea brasiliensis TaxID=3981 RepID=UPI0025D881CC|nr:probably inactive leucine-rich repeat receptor-like protein kinase At5g06940 [Hevea brasiliensis]